MSIQSLTRAFVLTEAEKTNNRENRARSRECETRRRILAAAARAFAQYGQAKTTMEDIAETAQVARATVYKHFRTKEEVFRAVVHCELADIVGASREAAAQVVGTRAKLRAAILTQLREVRGKVNFYRVTVKSLSDILPVEEEERELLTDEALRMVKEILTAGIKAGEIAVRDLDLAARAVVVAYHGLVIRTMISTTDRESEQLVDTLLAMFFEGMVPRKEGG
jgi:AcrR family transcriptional regulator